MSITVKATSKKYPTLGSKPFAFLNVDDFKELCALARMKPDSPEVKSRGVYVQVKGSAISVQQSDLIEVGYVYFTLAMRQTLMLPFNADVVLSPLTDVENFMYLKSVTVEIGYFRASDNKKKRTLDCDIAASALKKEGVNLFLNRGQMILKMLKLPEKLPMKIVVRDMEAIPTALVGSKAEADPTHGTGTAHRGILQAVTEIKFVKTPQHSLLLENTNQNQAADMFNMQDLSFSSMGIGGLDGQFGQIFRRAFASRLFPAEYMKKLGLSHVKGILMHGPPGCGKTLIARQLSKALKAREPKIVNGPEIFDRYVGASEEKIRELFADAEKEYEESGDASQLHVIIFDEIDAICKKRGSVSGSTGVNDSVVNQLLSKIDGVDALNNILVIGKRLPRPRLPTATLFVLRVCVVRNG